METFMIHIHFASTETNDISEESSDNQRFGAKRHDIIRRNDAHLRQVGKVSS